MNRLLIPVAAMCLTMAAGCETGPRPPPIGASVQPIENGRYRVTYRGKSRMSPPEVQDRALLEAAKLALSGGFSWFKIASRSGGPAPATSPQFSLGLGVGGGSFGRGGGVGGGVGGAETFGGGDAFMVTLEILEGQGPRPSEANTYDAQDVANTLGARFPNQ